MLGNGLKELDALLIRLDIKVVIVSFFFDAMKTLLVTILAMGNETGIFRGPSGVRGPLIVEYFVAKLITAAARLETFLGPSQFVCFIPK